MSHFHRARAGRLTAFSAMLLTACAAGVPAQQPASPPRQEAAVTGILATNPTTPRERARAARILADLGRPDLARPFLKLVLDAKLDQAQLASLAEEFGTAMFTEMAARADLAPEARLLADAVLRAINKKLGAPDRLAGLVGQLQDPSPDTRYRALTGLMQARGQAVAPLVAVLADPARAKEYPAVRTALAQLGSDAVGPLIGILEADNPRLVAQAAQVLGQMNARQATLYLLVRYASAKSTPEVRAAAGAALDRLIGKRPTPAEAAGLLAQYARRTFDGKEPVSADAQGRVRVWVWDNPARHVAPKDLPAADASRLIAARLAREAHALAPDDPQIRLLYLATMLEQAACAAGRDTPLPTGQGSPVAKAASFGVETVGGLLKYAMDTGHAPAATVAAQILGRDAQADAVLRQGSEPAPLVLATRHADRRLRMAAVEAILRLQPAGPFPGSSYVPEALEFFAATSGTRRVLLAGPSSEVMMGLAGYLIPLGYEVDVVITGRELVQRLIRSPDYELAMVDAGLDRPTPDLAIQQLRRDGRTAGLPVGIVARADQFERAERFARHDPLALAFYRPHTPEAARWQVDRLTGLVQEEMVPFAQRQKQAARAIGWLAELSARSQKVYNVQRVEDTALGALYVPQLGPKAAAVLAELGTPESQTALVEIASRMTQPLAVRKAAVVAFGQSTRRYGILLRTEQIRRQYDRYNQSAEQDAATQKILGLILDWIEAPTQAVAQVKKEKVQPERKP